ncbi:ABC transporter ATP-binding protein [Alteribacter natronophilus]|uniref:ABC transporter ATP-binding protein n=1 Tax=Alteribacter natronophilus TaxID=2583810 RepID=UPI00110D32C5|nr:ABC transporter ATP-binding protein [Alteribacter natronophilus]TMW72908.1 ABC transporter ATP-binding protein [Alteribacter natronophilus]
MTGPLFHIENVTKTYKKGKVTANKAISFTIRQGEILGLLGPNGAGKSTLVKQLVAHLKPTEGEVHYKGTNVLKQMKTVAREVAYYAQEPHALTSLTVKEAIYFSGRLRGMKKNPAKEETAALIEELELTEVAGKMLKNISGGQKRLTGIGTTLIGKAGVYIFDEPTNELDPKKRRLVWDLIRKRNREGATVILVTHNILEAEQVVDRVAVVNHGQLLAINSVAELKAEVDQRLKCEITTAPGHETYAPDFEASLDQHGTVSRLSDQRLRVLISKEEAPALLEELNTAWSTTVQTYSLMPPSLEDVYFHIDRDENEETATPTETKGENQYAAAGS